MDTILLLAILILLICFFSWVIYRCGYKIKIIAPERKKPIRKTNKPTVREQDFSDRLDILENKSPKKPLDE